MTIPCVYDLTLAHSWLAFSCHDECTRKRESYDCWGDPSHWTWAVKMEEVQDRGDECLTMQRGTESKGETFHSSCQCEWSISTTHIWSTPLSVFPEFGRNPWMREFFTTDHNKNKIKSTQSSTQRVRSTSSERPDKRWMSFCRVKYWCDKIILRLSTLKYLRFVTLGHRTNLFRTKQPEFFFRRL